MSPSFAVTRAVKAVKSEALALSVFKFAISPSFVATRSVKFVILVAFVAILPAFVAIEVAFVAIFAVFATISPSFAVTRSAKAVKSVVLALFARETFKSAIPAAFVAI